MMGGEWTDIGWLGMGIGMVFWIVLLAVIIGAIVAVMNRAQSRGDDRRGESADEVLRRRFAGGDIDAEEYERRLAVLRR
jgi:putative membrane protein